VVVGAAVALAACSASGGDVPEATTTTTTTTAAPTTTTAPPPIATVVAAGDLVCLPDQPVTPAECQMEATAQLAESLEPDVVLALGDIQYELGRPEDYVAYDRTWGRMKAITRPVIGNHEYAGGEAPGYFGYFGEAAHPPGGWYSFDVGPWHVVVLNSVCGPAGGCHQGSRQYEWLRADLEATTSECILAAWHHPRWSSGIHHSDPTVEPFWQLLAQHGGDLVLGGHDHHYERFAPERGIVQVVVGTGGRSLYPAPFAEAGTVVRDANAFGVLELELHEGSYRGAFRPVPGRPFSDEFSADC
jgi:acid phosphatase type 7